MGQLSTKVAVVTGGSRGIGAGIARRLAAEGAKVVVNYASRADAAEQVVADIQKGGGDAIALQTDMGDLDAIRRLFAETKTQYGRLDILVNNAAIAEFMPLDAITPEHYERHFAVNVRGPIFAMQEAARLFDEAGGCIINISSSITTGPAPSGSVYSATKAALENLTRSYAHELGSRGITVNAVAPGTTESDMLNAVMPPEMQQRMIANTALGRLGTPEDIAAVVAFLASNDGRWVTGQIIHANGGLR
jgi:3-oxoacyl-[acyl-carrier protein] reductase